jgi:hypothetical protein
MESLIEKIPKSVCVISAFSFLSLLINLMIYPTEKECSTRKEEEERKGRRRKKDKGKGKVKVKMEIVIPFHHDCLLQLPLFSPFVIEIKPAQDLIWRVFL